MDLLNGFDFDTVDCVPNAFDFKEIPPEHTQLLGELEKACQDGDLSTAVQTYSTLRRSHARFAVLHHPGSALRLAVEPKHKDTVQYLLSEGVEVSSNHVRLVTELKAKPIIELLLQYGWPVNEKLGWSDPPALAYAVEDRELTAWFLDRGADPNASCGLDKTPLSAAVQYAPLDIVHMLFAAGGSVRHGQLLHYAVWRKLHDRSAVVRYLLEMGAPLNAIMYHDKPDSYCHREVFGLGTPLHDAAASGDMDVLQILVERGADLRIRDTRGHLAHERAEANNHDLAAQFLRARLARYANADAGA